MKHFSTLILGILLLGSVRMCAQQRLEIGAQAGGSFYQGDILGQTVAEISPNIHGSASLQAGYFFNNHFGVRFSGGYGKMSGGDNFSEFPWRQQRNLSFHSTVYNLGLRAEYNVTGFDPARGQYFTIYPFLGYQHVFFDPKTFYRGKEYRLQPLGTEGQGLSKYPDKKPYKLNTPSVNFGAGMRIAVTERISLGAEISLFRTFTDYLDDVAGYYVPYTDILNEKGNFIAAALSNRENELSGNDKIIFRNHDEMRGNGSVSDYYYQFGLTFAYNFFDPFQEKAKKGYSRKKAPLTCFRF